MSARFCKIRHTGSECIRPNFKRPRRNVAAYWKRKYKGKQEKEPWFILTNLSSLEDALNVYRARTGIEALLKDCKTGGYNLEGSKANNLRLTSLILLIAMAYTATALKGQIIKNTGQSKYVARLQEKKRIEKRHSDFWVGLYGSMWIKVISADKLPSGL